jgi:uncharacterized SAM-binding protein YcdF (DUF218 family)
VIRALIRIVGLAAVAVVIGVGWVGGDILLAAGQSDPDRADAAIVLGAAVAGDEPTPVFEERLRHAVELYRTQQVEVLIMTGGTSPGDSLSESEAARRWAIANGVPAGDIINEAQSHTTKQNFVNALPLLAQRDIGRVLIVSDPLHMRRALRMAADLGLDAHPSPTPTSRYKTIGTQAPMLAREIWFNLVYMTTGQ